MVPAPPFVDSQYQLFSDLPWKVQVYVRHGAHLVVYEAFEGQVELQRVYVGQADQIADQHGYR